MSFAPRTNGQIIVRKTFMGAVTVLCALFVVLSVADYLVLRFRMAKFGPASTTASVTFFYAAPIKGNKVSVYSGQPQTETCVRSIFPWLGYDPCWYAKRHTIQLED
jgi:hypothetical protein